MGTTAPIVARVCFMLACIVILLPFSAAQKHLVRSKKVEGSLPHSQTYETAPFTWQPDVDGGQEQRQLANLAVDGVPLASAHVQGRALHAAALHKIPSAAANPAAAASTASAIPHLGVAPAGSKIPGRYVVIFNDNVTTVDGGIERLQRHVSNKLLQSSTAAASDTVAVAAVAAASGMRIAAATTDAVSADPPFMVRSKLGDDEEMHQQQQQQQQYRIAAVAPAASSSSSSILDSSSSSSRSRLRGVVIDTTSNVRARALYRALRSSADVRKVIQDRIISIAQDRCVSAKSLASISANAPALRWAGCKIAGAKIYWFGERCGANLAKTRWIGMYAVNATTSVLLPGCLQYRRSVDSDPWNAVHMGQCGIPPTAAPNLPASVCPDTDAAGCIPAARLTMLRVTLNKPVSCNSGSSSQLVLQGTRCGPGLGFVQWSSVMMPDGAGCSFNRSPVDSKLTNDWLGSCGVTPYNVPLPGTVCTSSQISAGISEVSSGALSRPAPSPLLPRLPPPPLSSPPPLPPIYPPPPPPSPPPPVPSIPSPTSPDPDSADSPEAAPLPPSPANIVPSEPLASGEFVPAGVQRLQAVYNNRVPDVSKAPVKDVVVAVVDTGVDSSHPDLNVVGGMNFVADEPDLSYHHDTHGHGTHVAGTIGAKNQGKGIVGMAPGIGIYALRVLKADGNGLFSDLLRAYDHLVANGRRLGVRVVNLSLSGSGDVSDEECGYIQQIIAQGMTVVTAAGNAGVSMLTEVPAACSGALVVTAVTELDGTPDPGDAAAAWSNYLPLPDTGDLALRIVAAPGDAITSTYPISKTGFNGYAKMSGTSMACPHVSGIVALCYSAGVCQRNAGAEVAKVLNPMAAWSVENPWFRFNGDPLTNPAPDRYYGFMAWSRKFWGR